MSEPYKVCMETCHTIYIEYTFFYFKLLILNTVHCKKKNYVFLPFYTLCSSKRAGDAHSMLVCTVINI